MSINILMKFLWIGSVFWSPEKKPDWMLLHRGFALPAHWCESWWSNLGRGGGDSAAISQNQVIYHDILYRIYIYIHTNSYIYSIYLSQITPWPFLWELCFKWTGQALHRTPTLSNPFLSELSSLTAHSAAISIWRTLFFVASVADEEIEMRADDILGH